MVIRDLTLRSAASFGSFHLIRLLFDEYMFYLVEHKVASSTGKTAIAIMSEVSWYIHTVSVMHTHTLGMTVCIRTRNTGQYQSLCYVMYLCSFLGSHQVQ